MIPKNAKAWVNHSSDKDIAPKIKDKRATQLTLRSKTEHKKTSKKINEGKINM